MSGGIAGAQQGRAALVTDWLGPVSAVPEAARDASCTGASAEGRMGWGCRVRPDTFSRPAQCAHAEPSQFVPPTAERAQEEPETVHTLQNRPARALVNGAEFGCGAAALRELMLEPVDLFQRSGRDAHRASRPSGAARPGRRCVRRRCVAARSVRRRVRHRRAAIRRTSYSEHHVQRGLAAPGPLSLRWRCPGRPAGSARRSFRW